MRFISAASPVAALLLMMVVVAIVYYPGLAGGFLFDDYPNLKEMGSYGGVSDWETFKSFVFQGWSGPTGRPLSLMSFLLDDNAWPSHAPWFKVTNLYIHMLNGLLLIWAALLLLRNHYYSERRALWMALFTASVWLLHPYFVSTTLYVVQRMAQLATLFVLVGFVIYLYGRLSLVTGNAKAYIWLSVSVSICTLLAVLSKENGALLPTLILVAEFCMPKANKPDWRWRAVFLWAPSIVISGFLLSYVDFSPDAWPSRPFNQVERLLTEGRILTEYLYHLFFPRIEGQGLFQDGYKISTGWFQPITTIVSWSFVFLLILFSFWLRKYAPLVSFSVLFYFASHLIESTVVGLELYFEHRNYMAALFLFLPIALALDFLQKKTSTKLVVTISLLLISMLSSMTWQRANLWSDSDRLELYWAKASTNSPRAHNAIAVSLIQEGRVSEAAEYLENAANAFPNSSLITASFLLHKINTSQAGQADFQSAAEKLAQPPFDAQKVNGLRGLVDAVIEKGDDNYKLFAIGLMNVISASSNYSETSVFHRMIPYLRARLMLSLRMEKEASKEYIVAMGLHGDTDAAMMMVAEMASAGYIENALILLEKAEEILIAQSDKTLKRSRSVYEYEISRLRELLINSADID